MVRKTIMREKQQISSKGNLFGAGAAAAALENDPLNSIINYDWTYFIYLGTTIFTEGQNNWKDEEKSGLDDLTLLTDRTQPILYFDDVNFIRR